MEWVRVLILSVFYLFGLVMVLGILTAIYLFSSWLAKKVWK